MTPLPISFLNGTRVKLFRTRELVKICGAFCFCQSSVRFYAFGFTVENSDLAHCRNRASRPYRNSRGVSEGGKRNRKVRIDNICHYYSRIIAGDAVRRIEKKLAVLEGPVDYSQLLRCGNVALERLGDKTRDG